MVDLEMENHRIEDGRALKSYFIVDILAIRTATMRMLMVFAVASIVCWANGAAPKIFLRTPSKWRDYSVKMQNDFVESFLRPILDELERDLEVEFEEIGVWTNASDFDIVLNLGKERSVDGGNLISIWPHQQMRYCFIHSNARKVPAHELLTYNLGTLGYITTITPLFISWGYHYLILRFRAKKTQFDSITRGLIYSIQKHVCSSIPTLDKYRHERFFLATMYMYIFVTVFMYLSFFATQCTIPTYHPAIDKYTSQVSRIPIASSQAIGVDEPCLRELLQGRFLRRVCFIRCDLARRVSYANPAIITFDRNVDFQQVFQMSDHSRYLTKTRQFLDVYLEAGLIAQIFRSLHSRSHRFLQESLSDQVVDLQELQGLIINTILVGLTVATVAFLGEIMFASFKKR